MSDEGSMVGKIVGGISILTIIGFMLFDTLFPFLTDFLFPSAFKVIRSLSKFLSGLFAVGLFVYLIYVNWRFRRLVPEFLFEVVYVVLVTLIGCFLIWYMSEPLVYLVLAADIGLALTLCIMWWLANLTKKRYAKYLEWFEECYRRDMISCKSFKGAYSVGMARIEMVELNAEDVETLRTKAVSKEQ